MLLGGVAARIAISQRDLAAAGWPQVFFDVGVASKALKSQEERTLGSKSAIPDDAEPIGRIVIGACWSSQPPRTPSPRPAAAAAAPAAAEPSARRSAPPPPPQRTYSCADKRLRRLPGLPAAGLYGNHVPATVANLTAAVQGGLFNDTTFSRVLPGEYIQAGKQGTRRMGEMQLGPGVELQASGAGGCRSRARRLCNQPRGLQWQALHQALLGTVAAAPAAPEPPPLPTGHSTCLPAAQPGPVPLLGLQAAAPLPGHGVAEPLR